MASDLRAKRLHRDWQFFEQKETVGRAGLMPVESNQPKPRAGWEQTAQGRTGRCCTLGQAALAMLAATAGCIVRRDARRLADDRAQPRPHPPLMP